MRKANSPDIKWQREKTRRQMRSHKGHARLAIDHCWNSLISKGIAPPIYRNAERKLPIENGAVQQEELVVPLFWLNTRTAS